MRSKWYLLVLVLAAALVLGACSPQSSAPANPPAPAAVEEPTRAPAPTQAPATAPTEVPAPPTAEPVVEEPAEPQFEAPKGALVSVPASQAPVLDAAGSDAAWQDAPELKIAVSGGANTSKSEVTLKSVYSGDTVYFLATWDDPTESFLRTPWEKQEDGTWIKLKDPNDKYSDNNLYYEDKFSIIWSINNSIANFETLGCFTACHAGENADAKPYGNKYTNTEGELGDIWHWKSVRNLGQIDDQYLDWTRYTADTPGAGRKSDKKDGGGYEENQSEDKTMPAFMAPAGGSKDGYPGYILDSEKVAFDDSLFSAGDRAPSIVISEFTGDRGDISASFKWADGKWTLEFSRKLDTGSATDVQFADLSETYYFGVATFDNSQVRHAFQMGATPFVFQP
jgi:hypothetical protein